MMICDRQHINKNVSYAFVNSSVFIFFYFWFYCTVLWRTNLRIYEYVLSLSRSFDSVTKCLVDHRKKSWVSTSNNQRTSKELFCSDSINITIPTYGSPTCVALYTKIHSKIENWLLPNYFLTCYCFNFKERVGRIQLFTESTKERPLKHTQLYFSMFYTTPQPAPVRPCPPYLEHV